MQTFATRNVDDVAIGWCDGNRPDGLRVLTIEDRIPRAAVIGRLPDTAIDLAYIEDIGLIGNTRCCPRATAAKGSDHAPMHLWHRRRVVGGIAAAVPRPVAAKKIADDINFTAV